MTDTGFYCILIWIIERITYRVNFERLIFTLLFNLGLARFRKHTKIIITAAPFTQNLKKKEGFGNSLCGTILMGFCDNRLWNISTNYNYTLKSNKAINWSWDLLKLGLIQT